MAQFEEFPSPTSRIEVCLDELAAHLGKAALQYCHVRCRPMSAQPKYSLNPFYAVLNLFRYSLLANDCSLSCARKLDCD